MPRRRTVVPPDNHKGLTASNLRSAIAVVATSQAEFARVLGVSESKLGNWLRGDNYPDPATLVRACERYGLTMDWFYRGHLAGVAATVADGLARLAQPSPAQPVAVEPEAAKKRQVQP